MKTTNLRLTPAASASATALLCCCALALLPGFLAPASGLERGDPEPAREVRGTPPPQASPDGKLTLSARIEPSHADETKYGCVIIEIRNAAGKMLFTVNTGASDFQKWSIAWSGNGKVVLKSSDIGDYAWTRKSDGSWKRSKVEK